MCNANLCSELAYYNSENYGATRGATYVHMLCIVLYYITCDLNASLLSSIKVVCGRCHDVQLACHCAVTGKCSKWQWRSECKGEGRGRV